MPLTVALKSEFFKGNWLFSQLALRKSLRIKRLLNTRTGVFRKDCVGAGARPGQTFLWIILLSDSEGRRACLRASLSIWRDRHFNETDLALRQQTESDELLALSLSLSLIQLTKEMRQGFSPTCDLLTPKGIWPESGRYSIFLVCFFSFNPYGRVPGCFIGFSVLVSPSPNSRFFITVVVEVNWSEVEKNERRVCFALDCTKQAY